MLTIARPTFVDPLRPFVVTRTRHQDATVRKVLDSLGVKLRLAV
jgi:hypothetical protein